MSKAFTWAIIAAGTTWYWMKNKPATAIAPIEGTADENKG